MVPRWGRAIGLAALLIVQIASFGISPILAEGDTGSTSHQNPLQIKIKVIEAPSTVNAGQDITFTWQLSGKKANIFGEVGHTNLHCFVDTDTHSENDWVSEDAMTSPKIQTYQTYFGSVTTDKSGWHQCRVHVLDKQFNNHLSDIYYVYARSSPSSNAASSDLDSSQSTPPAPPTAPLATNPTQLIPKQIPRVNLPQPYSENDFYEALKAYRLLLSALSESQYATRTRSTSSPLFITQENILNEFANKWLGYRDVANQLLTKTLVPDPESAILDTLTGGVYSEVQGIVTLTEVLKVFNSMNNDLDDLQKRLYSSSDQRAQAIYDRVGDGYSLPVLEATSDAILFFKLAGKYSKINQASVNEHTSYFENFIKKGVQPKNDYYVYVGGGERGEMVEKVVGDTWYTGPFGLHLVYEYSINPGKTPTVFRLGSQYDYRFYEDFKWAGQHFPLWMFREIDGPIYIWKQLGKEDVISDSPYAVRIEWKPKPIFPLDELSEGSYLFINPEKDGIITIGSEQIKTYLGKYGFSVPDKYRIVKLLLSDSEIQSFQKIINLSTSYSHKLAQLEFDVQQIEKGLYGDSYVKEDLLLAQASLKYIKNLLNFYGSSFVIENNYVITPYSFKNYISMFSDSSYSRYLDETVSQIQEFVNKVTMRGFASEYLDYQTKRLSAYNEIGDGLSKNIDKKSLLEFANKSEKLAGSLPYPQEEDFARKLREVFNSNSLNKQSDVVNGLITALNQLEDSGFYSTVSKYHDKYLKPIADTLNQLSSLSNSELEVWNDAKNKGSIDKQKLTEVSNKEIATINKAKENVDKNLGELINEFGQFVFEPVSEEYAVKKGDTITKEIFVPKGVDYVVLKIEQSQPTTSWYTSQPVYTVEYPYVAAQQVSYKTEKMSPTVIKDLCDCKQISSNSLYIENQQIHVKVTVNDLGSGMLWGLLAGPSDGKIRISFSFQDNTKQYHLQNSLNALQSLQENIGKLLDQHERELQSLEM